MEIVYSSHQSAITEPVPLQAGPFWIAKAHHWRLSCMHFVNPPPPIEWGPGRPVPSEQLPDPDRNLRERQMSCIESVLDPIETSVEDLEHHATFARPAEIVARAESLRAWDPHGLSENYILDLEQCGQTYGLFLVDGEFVVHPLRCRHKECPVCQSARTHKWYHKLKATTRMMTAVKHVTLTLRHNSAPLDQQLDKLLRCFRRLRQRKVWKFRTGPNGKLSVPASAWGYWTIEIKQSESDGLWHPHLHVIANMPYLHKEALSRAWLDITGDSYIVGICAVKADIAAYVSKYVAKTSSVFSAPVDPFELLGILKGRRLVQQFGAFPDLPEPDLPDVIYYGSLDRIAQLALQGRPEMKFLYRWLALHHPKELALSIYRAGPRIATHAGPSAQAFPD